MTTLDLRERNKQCDALRDLWTHLIPFGAPTFSQFDLWLNHCSFDEVVYAIRRTARKRVHTMMTLDHMIRYTSKVMNNRNPVTA